ncbi:MAG: hypothetical protein IPL24_16715 [Bacteroidetes bacterium]|nr:hypothetical protein [Bacteroidota bacterium]
MKIKNQILFIILLLNLAESAAQISSDNTRNEQSLERKLTIEPAIAIKPWPISDLLVSNLVQWNFKKHLSLVSHTSYSYNNAFLRDFNYIKTNYNYSLSQKLGIGASVYSKHSSHTFSLIAGIKYDAFKETMNNPGIRDFSASSSGVSPDMGIMYNLKIGAKKYFFSYRMYLPLTPYPIQTSDIYSIDTNLANFTLEFGIGIRLK